MVKWILIALLGLPVAEIGVFILVAANIGLVWALGLVLATTIAGLVILRMAGRGRFAVFRSTVAENGISGIEARMDVDPDGFFIVLGGILLVLPGFITDVVGVFLLCVPIRHWSQRQFHRTSERQKPSRNGVIDLAESEWQRMPERNLEKRPGRSDTE